MKWRPIKAAPTDGTYVLTFDPTAEKDEQIRIDNFSWKGIDKDGWPEYGWEGQPTHWMPLPKPPKIRKIYYGKNDL